MRRPQRGPPASEPVNPVMHAHRLLCSAFITEAEFQAALGSHRADLTSIGRYLALPMMERPGISPYFDRAFYSVNNPDVARSGVDPLLHFLETGAEELRAPHPLVDLRFIAQSDASVLGARPSAAAVHELLELDLAAPSPYFDPTEYRSRLGAAAPAHGMLRHFLTEGLEQGVLANPLLDHVWYAERYPDVNPHPYLALRHFIILGDIEGRSAAEGFDGTLYRARYPDIAAAGVPPLWHFLLRGREEGRQTPADTVPEPVMPTARAAPIGQPASVVAADVAAAYAATKALFARTRKARQDAIIDHKPKIFRTTDVAAAIAALRLPAAPRPVLSILVPMFNELDYTVDCLRSIARHRPDVSFEIVLADDCSTDPEAALLGTVKHLVLVRQPQNLGFIGNCNAAFARCRGAYVLLLNNDAQVLPGALTRMVRALAEDPALGAVGPKIIYPGGRLQEAGCYITPDGTSGMVGLFEDPTAPAYCYDRDVAYISGAALMLRRDLVHGDLFDPIYQPAYCEDVDLCLRLIAAGARVRYLHEAVVVHHLSVTTNRHSHDRKMRTIVANQARLVERWSPLINRLDATRVLAFYLPQFHPTPENDLWWGRGFTEWTNVAKARPSYEGHTQPHLPADLGFYDLRNPDALRAQADLARRYGIDGFCVYYYNFGARRVLDRPLEIVRANPDIPFHWCLCWANENWTRHWDGGEHAILLEQNYDAPTLSSIIADAVSQARDPRYITVHGKPLFLVYRPLQIPDPQHFARLCRAAFATAGFPGVQLAYVESMEAVNKAIRPADIGFDAAVEFPPHGLAIPATDAVNITKQDWAGYRYDYPKTAAAFVNREGVPYTRYPAIFPAWDNTPRQPLRGTSFDQTSPASFQAYAEEKLDEIRRFHMHDERLLFVNAWNEWAEGAHLEPDTTHGHQYLETLRDTLTTRHWS